MNLIFLLNYFGYLLSTFDILAALFMRTELRKLREDNEKLKRPIIFTMY